MAEELVNLFTTTLSSGINNSQTTMPLTATTGPGGALGTAGTWRFILGRETAAPEIVTGSSRSGSTVTIVRAQGGTAAASWPSGTTVALTLTEQSVKALAGQASSYVVAASDAPTYAKDRADVVCDGTADQTDINAAFATVGAGGTVTLTQGTFSLAAPVICQLDRVTLRGAGRSSTILARAASYTGSGNSALVQFNRDDITPASSLRPADGCEIRDLMIDGIYGGSQNAMHGLHFKCYRGTVDNVWVRYCSGRGIVVRGVTAAEHSAANDWSTYGTRVTNCKVEHNGAGAVFGDVASTDASIDHCELWQNAGPGFDTGAVWNEVASNYIWGNFTQSVAGGSAVGYGINLTGGAGRCNIVGNKVEQNRGGLRIVAGSEFQVVGNVFASNSTAIDGDSDGNSMPAGWYVTGATNQLDDVMIDGTGGAPAGVWIIGNTIDPNVYAGDKSRYAITFNSGAAVVVAYNTIGTGSTGQVNWNISGNFVSMTGNTFYVTEAAGTGTITSGNTSVVITHGLAYAPNPQDICITPTANTTSDPGNWWVSSVGATQFTVNVRSNPGASGFAFGWNVDIHRYA